MPKKFNLLSEEKEIENSIDDLVPVSKEKEKKIKEIISKAKKEK